MFNHFKGKCNGYKGNVTDLMVKHKLREYDKKLFYKKREYMKYECYIQPE